MTKMSLGKHFLIHFFALRTLCSRCMILSLCSIADCCRVLLFFHQDFFRKHISSVERRSAMLGAELKTLSEEIKNRFPEPGGSIPPLSMRIPYLPRLISLTIRHFTQIWEVSLMKGELSLAGTLIQFQGGVLVIAEREGEGVQALWRSLKAILRQKNERLASFEILLWMILKANHTDEVLGDFRELYLNLLKCKGEGAAISFARKQVILNAFERLKNVVFLFSKLSGRIGAFRYFARIVINMWRAMHHHHED